MISKKTLKLFFVLIMTVLLCSGCIAEAEEAINDIVIEDITPERTPMAILEPTVEPIVEPTEPILTESVLNVHFLDVGQGLSIFAECDGKYLLYDGGDRETSDYVVAYLKNMGVETIEYLISSHYDADHISGLIGCLHVFDVENIISADYVHGSKLYESFVKKADDLGLTMQHPAVGQEFSFGGAKFVILAPETIDEEESNENSVAIKLIHGENTFVVTGDAEKNSEADMCASGLDLDCDVLVPGHHGSATATTWDFLMKTVPEYAVISCGEGNSYGHPHAETMEKLESMEVQVYRTDKQGWLSVVSNGVTLDWSQEPCNDYSSGEEVDKIRRKMDREIIKRQPIIKHLEF